MFLLPAAHPVTRTLEGAWRDVAREVSAVAYDRYEAITDDKAERGAWGAYGILHTCDPQCAARWEPNAAACPTTAALLRRIRGLHIGGFVVMAPGTRLRMHRDMHEPRYSCFLLPLQVDRFAWMCVGKEHRVLEPGQCLVFDPRIEHASGNDGDRCSTVLFASVLHASAGLGAIELTA